MNYIIRRTTLVDHLITGLFIAASVTAIANLPAIVAAVFLVNALILFIDRALWMRARRRAFAEIGALQYLPAGVTGVSLFIPARERAL